MADEDKVTPPRKAAEPKKDVKKDDHEVVTGTGVVERDGKTVMTDRPEVVEDDDKDK